MAFQISMEPRSHSSDRGFLIYKNPFLHLFTDCLWLSMYPQEATTDVLRQLRMRKPVWTTKRRLLTWFLIGYLVGAIQQITPLRLFTAFTPQGFGWSDWTGLGEYNTLSEATAKKENDNTTVTTTETLQRGKTFWDLFSVLIVPLSLAFLAAWLQHKQQEQIQRQDKEQKEQEAKLAQAKEEQARLLAAQERKQVEREKKREEERAEQEKKRTEENQREEALQAYLDRVSALLIDKNLLAIAAKANDANEALGTVTIAQRESLDTATTIIRATTLSILRRLGEDGERKGSVIQFLSEAKIISVLKLSLKEADLKGANLERLHLEGADFEKADLTNANLRHAWLNSATFLEANLESAVLNGAILMGTSFVKSTLKDADLSRAILGTTKFRETSLEGAKLVGTNFWRVKIEDVSLKNADLTDAKNLDEGQFSSAKLCNTRLPGGCKLESNRDCKKLETSPTEPPIAFPQPGVQH